MASYAEHHAPLVHQVGNLVLHAMIRKERPVGVRLGVQEREILKDYSTFKSCPPLHQPKFLGLPVEAVAYGIELITV